MSPLVLVSSHKSLLYVVSSRPGQKRVGMQARVVCSIALGTLYWIVNCALYTHHCTRTTTKQIPHKCTVHTHYLLFPGSIYGELSPEFAQWRNLQESLLAFYKVPLPKCQTFQGLNLQPLSLKRLSLGHFWHPGNGIGLLFLASRWWHGLVIPGIVVMWLACYSWLPGNGICLSGLASVT